MALDNESEKTNSPVSGVQTDSYRVSTEQRLNQVIEIGTVYRPADYGLLLMRQGTIRFRYNLSEYELEKNALLFVQPNSVYEFVELSPDVKFISTLFPRDFLQQSALHVGSAGVVSYFSSGVQPFYVIGEQDSTVLLGLLETLQIKLTAGGETSYYQQVAYFSMLAILYEAASIYRKYNAVFKRKLNRKQELALGFLQLLSSYSKEERSVQFYAESLFVSSKHLTEVLKSVTGKKAGELIDQAVILEAKVLLRNTAMNIAQTADALHFSDQFFFSKFFKKKTGLTPSQFRSQN